MDPTKNLGPDSDQNPTEIASAVAAGLMAADVSSRTMVLEHDGFKLPVALGEDGTPKLMGDVLAEVAKRQPGPPRRKGTSTHDELDSFVAYVNRFKNPTTVVFAQPKDFSVLAVLDYHEGSGAPTAAGWAGHRAAYACPRSLEWKNWTGQDGQDMRQEAFADWIEQHADDIGAGTGQGFPTAAELMEMARNLHIFVSGQFSKALDPTTGTGSLVVKEEHAQQSTKIPKAFGLRLRVFEGGEVWEVEARVRFRIVGGNAIFTYGLHRREEIERMAFDEVRKVVAEKTSCPLFVGKPEPQL